MSDQPKPTTDEYPDPTPQDLESTLFNSIWNAIKGWDLSRHLDTKNGHRMYAEATGNDVMHIIQALAATEPKLKPTTGEWTLGESNPRVVWRGDTVIGIAINHEESARFADAHNAALAAERELLYRIGRRMMESQATGEPLNLDLLRSEIDAVLYPPKTPEKFA